MPKFAEGFIIQVSSETGAGMRFLTGFIALIIFLASSAPAAVSRQLVIYKSHDYISRNYQVQNFTDTLALQPGQETLPLVMTIYNGSPEVPSFKWFRIMVNGEILATEKDMLGREAASKDVSGLIRGSNLQVQIEAGGVPGANLWWTLETSQMELSYVEPNSVMQGETVKLLGSNFPSDPAGLTVTLNGKAATVLSASPNTLLVQVPKSAELGVNHVEVRSNGVTTSPVSLSIMSRPLPEIMGVDCWMAPPGGTINISGRNFSPDAGANKVFFGSVPGQVSSSTGTSMAVIVPNWSYGPSQLNIPISVEVNGVRSANTFPFDIGPMYHGAVPQFGHD